MTAVEIVAARVKAGHYASVVAYQPGSATIQLTLFDEMSSLFKSTATYSMPVYTIGDFKIQFNRPDDTHTCQLLDMIRCFGFHMYPTDCTQQLGNKIYARDVVLESACQPSLASCRRMHQV